MQTQYNPNIQLVHQVGAGFGRRGSLQPDEYYALMVVDYGVAARSATAFSPGDSRQFFEKKTGRLGLERTSEGRIYISKEAESRTNALRGETWVVRVKDPQLCSVLRGAL